MAVDAFVLVEVNAGKVADALRQISQVEGVKTAHAVTGPYDIIAHVEANDTDALGKKVVSKVQGVQGVLKTLTCMVVKI